MSESAGSRRGSRTGALTIGSLSVAVVLGALDYSAMYPGTQWWIVAVPAIACFGFFALRKGTIFGRAAFAAVALWAVILPHIRWGPVKPFYIDCQRLRKGTLLSEVRLAMRAYHLQKDAVEENGESSGARLVFHPSLDYSADWCIVEAHDGQVTHIGISPD